ncbi:hypothetical protein [Nonomuraea sp. WAC 01424]|nr:hypothetical protein [Nonomuraea sp. WAC 01424]
MSDGLAMRLWPYQTSLPRHPEPAEESTPIERAPGLIDEAN